MSFRNTQHDNPSASKQPSRQPSAQYAEELAAQSKPPGTTAQTARLTPHHLTAGDVLQLQQQIGNQAVEQLLTAKADSPRSLNTNRIIQSQPALHVKPQLSHVAQPTVQLKRIGVGFDRVNSGGPGDVLITSDLGNCIAVAVQDPQTKTTVMSHFDTGAIQDLNKVSTYLAFRSLLLNELERVVGQTVTEPTYHICLGFVWLTIARSNNDNHDVTPETQKKRRMLQSMIAMCKGVFYGCSLTYGGTAEFDIDAGAMKSAVPVEDEPMSLPEGWAKVGDEIPYADLQGEDSRKWKLAKNRSLWDRFK